MVIKYVVCPDLVTSKTDRDRHYIGASQLMMLYGVSPSECVIYEPMKDWPEAYYRMAEERHKGLIRLEPRYDGKYELPKC